MLAVPIIPFAVAALKYSAVAGTAYGIARSIERGVTTQAGEDALDDTPEGITANMPKDRPGQANGTARFRRIVRLGQNGPGVEIDASSLVRIKFRKI